MLLIQCSVSLLVVYAGMKLLAKTQKETLGNFHKYVSWFLIIMGFLMFGCACCCCIKRCCGNERMMRMEKNCRMEMNCNGGGCMMEVPMNCPPPMMGCNHGRPMCGGHGNGMMMGGRCGEHNMNGCGGNQSRCGEMNEECESRMKKCGNDEEDSEESPMKKGDCCKKDSLKKK